MKGFDGPVFAGYLGVEDFIANSRQWDLVWPDGDLWKAGLQTQGLYVSPSRRLASAMYATLVLRVTASPPFLRNRSLSEALRKVTLIPAQILEKSVPQMKKKGRLQVGADADIAVFDPATIQDKATFIAPAQTSVGFRHVVVDGVPIILDASRIANARPGKPVRRNV